MWEAGTRRPGLQGWGAEGGAGEEPQFLRVRGNCAGRAGLRAFPPRGPPSGPPSANPRPDWWRPAARPLLFFEYIRSRGAAAAGGSRTAAGPCALTPPRSPAPLASLAPAPCSSLPPPPPQARSPPGPDQPCPAFGGVPAPRPAAAGPSAMELLQRDPAVRGAAERPGHLPGLRPGAQGLLGSPERAATFSPVATLTRTMHDLAGLGR